MNKHARLRQQFVSFLLQQLHRIETSRSQLLTQADDDEALHQLRVALRRFRSAAAVVRPWLSQTKALALLKRLAKASNPLRDLAVLGDLIASRLAKDWPEHATWLAAQRQAEQGARAQLFALLGEEAQFSAAITALRQDLAAIGRKERVHLHPHLRQERKRLVKRLLAKRRRLRHTMASSKRWHALRLDCKRLRYLLASAPSAHSTHWLARAKAAKQAQTALGRLHDLDSLMARLRGSGPMDAHLQASLQVLEAELQQVARLRVLRLAEALPH